MARLQLACDMTSVEMLMGLVPKLVEYVDIFEMGTPMCLMNGVRPAALVHEAYPDKEVLADTKIFDGGKLESEMYIDAGASYITVMSRTNNQTIRQCIEACHAKNAKCVVDLMCEQDFDKRVPELEEMGADILAVHVAYDDYMSTGMTPLKSLKELSRVVKKAKTAVAGGIKIDNIKDYMQYNPEIVIVGGSILGSKNPIEAARLFAEAVH